MAPTLSMELQAKCADSSPIFRAIKDDNSGPNHQDGEIEYGIISRFSTKGSVILYFLGLCLIAPLRGFELKCEIWHVFKMLVMGFVP